MTNVTSKKNIDGVEVHETSAPPGNFVPVNDWGTGFRPSLEELTTHLGKDPEPDENTREPKPGFKPQGYVPPSNHRGDDLSVDDIPLGGHKANIVDEALRTAASPTFESSVVLPVDSLGAAGVDKKDVKPLLADPPKEADSGAAANGADSGADSKTTKK